MTTAGVTYTAPNAALKVTLLTGATLAAFLLFRLLWVVAQAPVAWLSSPALLSHAAFALTASLLTVWMLLMPKGTVTHRWVGRTWAVMLLVIAGSSFALREGFGRQLGWPLGLGPLHLLSAWTILQVILGVLAIRRGRVQAHVWSMVGVSWGLLIAGLFTLLPGRLMNLLLLFSV